MDTKLISKLFLFLVLNTYVSARTWKHDFETLLEPPSSEEEINDIVNHTETSRIAWTFWANGIENAPILN